VKLVVACAILHNWILGFGIDEVVPTEEGFIGSSDPTNLPPAHVDEDSVEMTEIRDVISNTMWEGRGTNTT
jgi:hypothetical protein